MAKSLIDFILPEDYDRYNELLNLAEQAKANATANVKQAAYAPQNVPF